MNFTVNNFLNSNNKINKKYICTSQGGNNECPTITWKCIDNAKSYVIIMEDPDASKNFVHLFLYIDAINNKNKYCSTLSQQYYFGKNSLGENSYHGPCAPDKTGIHRYIFTIYAFDNKIKINNNNDKIDSSTDFINKINKNVNILFQESITYNYSYKNYNNK